MRGNLDLARASPLTSKPLIVLAIKLVFDMSLHTTICSSAQAQYCVLVCHASQSLHVRSAHQAEACDSAGLHGAPCASADYRQHVFHMIFLLRLSISLQQ